MPLKFVMWHEIFWFVDGNHKRRSTLGMGLLALAFLFSHLWLGLPPHMPHLPHLFLKPYSAPQACKSLTKMDHFCFQPMYFWDAAVFPTQPAQTNQDENTSWFGLRTFNPLFWFFWVFLPHSQMAGFYHSSANQLVKPFFVSLCITNRMCCAVIPIWIELAFLGITCTVCFGVGLAPCLFRNNGCGLSQRHATDHWGA